QVLKFASGEPLLIGVAGIAEAVRHWPRIDPVLAAPPRMVGLDDVHVTDFDGVTRLVFRDQRLMQLFTGPDANEFDLAAGRDGLGHVHQPHAGNLGDENLATVHALNAFHYETHALLEGDPEARHTRIGDRDFSPLALLEEHRDHADSAADDISVAGATEARILRSGICVGLHEHFLGTELGRAIEIDRVYGLVGTECQDPADTAVDGRIDDILAAHDVGLNGFERVVLAGGNLLECGGMYHDSYPRQSTIEAGTIADVADEISQTRIVEPGSLHVVLLQFITAENDELLRPVIAQHYLGEFLPERAGSTSDQHYLFSPIHLWSPRTQNRNDTM